MRCRGSPLPSGRGRGWFFPPLPSPNKEQHNKKMHPCEVGCIFLLRGKIIEPLLY
jgi:hypothetical protein